MQTNDLYPGKIIFQYKRNAKNQLQGVVLAIGPEIMGWALCSKHDIFNKETGVRIALRRALKSATLSRADKIKYYTTCPNSLQELFVKGLDRSVFYFQKNYVHPLVHIERS